ncbi:MAG: hypothetical protein AAGA68_22560 [Pseudomonadota bacterium]
MSRLLEGGPLGISVATTAWLQSIAGDLAMALSDPRAAAGRYREPLELAECAQVRAALLDARLADGDRDAARATVGTSSSLALQVWALMVVDATGREHCVSHAMSSSASG